MNTNIFRAYDIRGIYPDEINAEVAERLGNATVRFLNGKNIVVGHDGRISSPELGEAIIKGLIKAGANVFNINLCTTPLFYFSVNKTKADGGIMITASHNPPEYNGFKIVGPNLRVIYSESGLREIRELSESDFSASRPGSMKSISALDDYIDFLLKNSDVTADKLKKIKFVLDTSNGTAPVVLKPLLDKLSLEPIILNAEIDGNFPNHLPDISRKENLLELKSKILETGADIGFAFDGDADRLTVMDERGEKIGADFIIGLLFKSKSRWFRKPKVAYDLRFSRSIRDLIGKNGHQSRTGYPLIRTTMEEFDADLGGELSGHFDFKEMGYAESAILATLKILTILASSGKTVSELIEPFKKYFNSGEINIPILTINDQRLTTKAIEDKLKEVYRDERISELDGVSVEYDDWWFNLRPSNTEPILRLVVEADSEELMERKKDELVKIIKTAA